MTLRESNRRFRTEAMILVGRAFGEAVGLLLFAAFLGLVLELVMPDGHSHGTPVVLMAFIAGAIPGAAFWALARIAKPLLGLLNLSNTRWRFIPTTFFGLAATCAALLVFFSLYVFWRGL